MHHTPHAPYSPYTKELYDMTKPGGVLLIAVPAWCTDHVFFVSARAYGPKRLPLLLSQDRWQVLIIDAS
jgi:hypothetical protein